MFICSNSALLITILQYKLIFLIDGAAKNVQNKTVPRGEFRLSFLFLAYQNSTSNSKLENWTIYKNIAKTCSGSVESNNREYRGKRFLMTYGAFLYFYF